MKNKKKQTLPLKCHYCDNKPTHAIMLELRARQGPPLKENHVLHLACDIHSIETSFDYYVPHWAFRKMYIDWKQQAGVELKKEYCTIKIVKFQ
jgi:hypothetical protein